MVLARPFNAPTKIFEGSYDSLVPQIIDGSWIFLTCNFFSDSDVYKNLQSALGEPITVFDNVPSNPSISFISKFVDVPRVDYIFALGGGSVMDAAKGLSIMQLPEISEEDLIKHLKNGRPLPRGMKPAPLVCAPTTSGTGSEVTQWGTIWGDDMIKYSLTDSTLFPKFAILDPQFSVTMPQEITLSSGLDAVSQAIEAVWNCNHTLISDNLAKVALTLLKKNLSTVVKQPENLEARKEVQLAATISGLAMGTTQTALCHSISYPFTSHFGVPHGIACSFTLPAVAEFNQVDTGNRLTPISEGLGCSTIEGISSVLRDWLEELGVSAYLSKYFSSEDFQRLDIDLIDRSRAPNNIREVNGIIAKELVEQSLESLGIE